MARAWMLLLIVFTLPVIAAKDPTAPLGWQKEQQAKAVKKTLSPPTLSGITCGLADSCYAVLNGKVADVGDVIGGFKVTNISHDAVTVSRKGKLWQLSLFSKDVKQ